MLASSAIVCLLPWVPRLVLLFVPSRFSCPGNPASPTPRTVAAKRVRQWGASAVCGCLSQNPFCLDYCVIPVPCRPPVDPRPVSRFVRCVV